MRQQRAIPSLKSWVFVVVTLIPPACVTAESPRAGDTQRTLLGVSPALKDELKLMTVFAQRKENLEQARDAKLTGDRRMAEADNAIARIDELCRAAAQRGFDHTEVFRLKGSSFDQRDDEQARKKLATDIDPAAMKVWNVLVDKGLHPKWSLGYEKPVSPTAPGSHNRQWVIVATW